MTTKGPQIDALYKRFNTTFELEDLYFSYLEAGIEAAVQEVAASERELLRGYMFQSLTLIFIDRQFDLGLKRKAMDAAPEVADVLVGGRIDLEILVDALRDPDSHPSLSEFVGSTKGTNVARAKAVRFLYLDAAI
jgi:hypothetical protein